MLGRLDGEEGRGPTPVVDEEPVARLLDAIPLGVRDGLARGLVQREAGAHDAEARMDGTKLTLDLRGRGWEPTRIEVQRPMTSTFTSWVPELVLRNKSPADAALPSWLFANA